MCTVVLVNFQSLNGTIGTCLRSLLGAGKGVVVSDCIMEARPKGVCVCVLCVVYMHMCMW